MNYVLSLMIGWIVGSAVAVGLYVIGAPYLVTVLAGFSTSFIATWVSLYAADWP